MTEWTKVDLQSLCSKITKGTTPTTLGGRFVDSGINFIKSESISYNGSIDETKFAFIDLETHEKLTRSQIVAGDILYSIAGVNLGKVASARTDHLPANTNQAIAIIRVKNEKANRKFIEYVLRNRSFVKQVLGGVAQSAQPNVNLTEIGRFLIPLPPRSHQEKIASILSALDDKIDLNLRMNQTLEAMARAIFKDWFVDFGPTRAKAESRTPYLAPELWELFPESLDGEGKPVGWARVPLDEIADFLNGLALQKFPALYPDDSLPVIKIAELRGGITPKSNRVSRDVPHKYIVRNGDFLFSWSGSLLAKFWTEGEGALNQHLFKVTSDRFPSWFFSQWIYHHLEQFRAIAASKATTMGHIQRRHLKEAMTVFPPESTLASLGQIIGPLVALTIKNKLESRTLTRTRDLLLPKLISGEIRLSEAEKAVEAVA